MSIIAECCTNFDWMDCIVEMIMASKGKYYERYIIRLRYDFKVIAKVLPNKLNLILLQLFDKTKFFLHFNSMLKLGEM